MNEREEYVGRALNIACRLQNAVKEKDTASRLLQGACIRASLQ